MAASSALTRGTRKHRPGGLACIVAVLLLMTVGSAPASATTIERFHATQPYDFVHWDCGYPVEVAGESSDTVVVRADKQLDGNVFFTDSYSFKETWTAADGRWLTITGNGVNKDVKAKPIGGSVYEFTFNNPGQTTITDSSGTIVTHSRGNLSFSYTIDIATGEGNFLGVRVSGPHPLLDVDWCRVVAPLIGTDSARHLAPRPLGSTDAAMGYYEYLPPSYSDTGNRSPLLVALNGYGENGDGTSEALPRLLWTGIPRFIDIGGWPTDRPLVVLATQHEHVEGSFDNGSCQEGAWVASCSMQLQHDRNHVPPAFCTTPDEVHDFIAYAVAHYNVDPKRVYVTGLSCGAFGAWEYLAKYGDQQVAAAVPIAGDGRPSWVSPGCGLSSVALWAFHGELDDMVNPEGSIGPMTQLAACPGVPANRARLTIYPGLQHEGWDQAYSGSLGDDIYTWMLAFSKP
jgi:hypothetical protein